MNALLFPVFDFVAKNRWLQIVLLCISGLIIVRIWMHFHDENVRKLQRADEQRRALEEQARVDETVRGIDKDNQDAAQAADEAVRDLPRYRATDELRNGSPGTAEIVLGPAGDRGQ